MIVKTYIKPPTKKALELGWDEIFVMEWTKFTEFYYSKKGSSERGHRYKTTYKK